MRILHGKFKGRKIQFKPDKDLRPTPDKVKQSIFSTLLRCIVDSSVLDLFSGTGALGMEALSLGATDVTFVENNRAHIKRTRETLEQLKLTDVVCLECVSVWKVWSILQPKTYDVIFADPPYEKGASLKLLKELPGLLLKPGGWLVLETSKRESLPNTEGNLQLIRQSKFGDTLITYYQKI
jgi:16S rRNA (guanine966-N2)-methyltransferase